MTAPLVVFGEDWGAYPSSTQHLIRAMLPQRRVLWVDSIGLRQPRLADAGRAVRKLAAMVRGRHGLRPPSASPRPEIVLMPPAIPCPGSRFARVVNRRLLGGALRRRLEQAGMARPILWASLPTAADVLGALGERAIVYYCGDDFGALEGVDHAPVLAAEARLAARADLILAASPALAAKFPHGKTTLLPHGVDLAKFGRLAPRPADLPEGKRIAGYYGSLSGWLDADVLACAAQTMPDWCFFLVGPVRTEMGALAALPNVVLAGPRRHDELPAYVQHWDVAMIPFRDTAQIRACNPLKLREYLASGTPVAATPMPALDKYHDLIQIGRTSGQFIAALQRAAAEGRDRAPARQQRVAGESWQARACQVALLLQGLES